MPIELRLLVWSAALAFVQCLVAVTGAYLQVGLPRAEPIVEVRLFFRRQFATANMMMLALGAILFGTIQLIPQLLQVSFQYTATLSGLVLMPGGIAMLLLMPLVGLVSNYIPPKYLIGFGMAVVAASMWHMMRLSSDADFSFFA